jgi:Holliday junction resolvase RusA-like endonuclease
MIAGVPYLTLELAGPVVGKGRPRFTRAGHTYTPSATVTAESRLSYAMAQAWTAAPLDEPLALRIEVRVPIPASKSKRWQAAALAGDVLPISKPDLDNILKLVADAGNKLLWSDDARITEVAIRRRYAAEPGISIEVCRG